MNPKIVFRADGSTSIGLGHIVRLIALADILRSNFYCCFALQNPSEHLIDLIKSFCHEVISLPTENDFLKEAHAFSTTYLTGNEIVVLDGYNFKSEYQKIIKSNCKKLVYVDDLHSWQQVADVVLNHAENVTKENYTSESYTQFYLGLKYALLRKEFFQKKSIRRSIPSLTKLFVSMGGTDIHNVTLKIMEALSTITSIENITLLVGKVNVHHSQIEAYIKNNSLTKFHLKSNISAQELFRELSSSHLAICPASTTAVEACAVGIGIVSGFTASNQMDILKGLEQNNCIINLGDLTTVSVEQIRTAVLDLIENTEPLVKMMLAQSELIDGKSPERLLQLFTNLAHA